MDDTQQWSLTSVIVNPFKNHPEDLKGMKMFSDGIELKSSIENNNGCTYIYTKQYDTEECNGLDGFETQTLTINTS